MKVKTELICVCFATLADKLPNYLDSVEVSYFFVRSMVILLRLVNEYVLADKLNDKLRSIK